MTTLTILRGLPGSGKTTRARELVADDPRCARVNRDDLRMMMFGAKVNLTPAQERAVTLAEHAMARALLSSWNVVADDMNLIARRTVNPCQFAPLACRPTIPSTRSTS